MDKTYVHVGAQVFRVEQSKLDVDNAIITALKTNEPKTFIAVQVLGSEQNVQGRLIIGPAQTFFTTESGV